MTTTVDSLDGFTGKRIRSSVPYQSTIQTLHAEPISMDPSEIFTGLQRGLVDGYGFALPGPRESGWLEVTHSLLAEPFLNQDLTILANPDSLDALSTGQHRALTEATKT